MIDTILSLRSNRRAFKAAQAGGKSFIVGVLPSMTEEGVTYSSATYIGPRDKVETRAKPRTTAIYRIIVTPKGATK